MADYLEKVQWKQIIDEPPTKMNPPKVILDNLHLSEDPFNFIEFEIVIGELKKNKAPGPDLTTAEMLQQFDRTNLEHVLTILNDIWITHDWPDPLDKADNVSIFEKGDAKHLGNYRPIALPNLFYKVITAMVRNRLINKLEPYLHKTQY